RASRILGAPASGWHGVPAPRDRGDEAIRALADVLGVLRVVLAIVFAASLDDGCKRPLIAFVLAVLFDYVDGRLARRAGPPSRYGSLLDSGADIVFVLAASG